MFLGALLDAGLSFESLKEMLAQLPINDYQLALDPFSDKGIHGSRFDVILSEQEQPTRHLSDSLLSTTPPRFRSVYAKRPLLSFIAWLKLKQRSIDRA